MLYEGGTLALTSKSLQFKPASAIVKWSIQLKYICELKREASGYLTSGKIDFQIDPSKISPAKSEISNKAKTNWQCQVCEEINESILGTKCHICGSSQKGTVVEIKIDDKSSWKCEVCEEDNDGIRTKCSVCGFSRKKHTEPNAGNWTCSICTFVNPATVDSTCQVCEAPRSAVIISSLPSQSVKVENLKYRLSFRSGGSTVFFTKLKSVWEAELAKSSSVPDEEVVTVGISGLLRRQEEKKLSTEASLLTAFSDLDALMRSAGEMVQLASKISEKIATATGDLSSKERNTFNDLVESLGIEIDSNDSSLPSSTLEFYSVIARNVSSLVQNMIVKTGTRVYSLADIFCIYNRARTTGNLIAPADLLKAARQMSSLNLPIRLHKFTTKGMLCLVPAQDIDPLQLLTLIRKIIQEKGNYLTAVDLAEKSKISLFLADEQLEMAERTGKIVRDGKRKDLPAFYLNIFLHE